MLRIEGVSCRFGAVEALAELDLEVGTGEVVGLIGPNGSGKTTLFNVVTGVYAPGGGRVWLRDVDISGEKPAAVRRCFMPPGPLTG